MKSPAYKPKTHYRTRHSSREHPIIDAACDFGPTALEPSDTEPTLVPPVFAAAGALPVTRRARLGAAVVVLCGFGGGVLCGALLALS